MRDRWARIDWHFVRFVFLCVVIGSAVLSACAYSIWASDKECHVVYVATTPVDGKPALERQDVCDRPGGSW